MASRSLHRFKNYFSAWNAAAASQKLQEQRFITEQQKRLDRIKKYCGQQKSPHTIVHNLQTIFVDDKHKVLYCAIPKTGSSAWKWNLMALNTNNVSSVEMGVMVHTHEYLAK